MRIFFLFSLLGSTLQLSVTGFGAPLTLHPDNPHYFQYKGKATILITSGEHYGALLNRDFDYLTYLETLRQDGLNLTRIFSGAYVEPDGAFKITKNTLAPAHHRFISPWARSSTPGYTGGGNKFNLLAWNERYFLRLKDLISEAQHRDIIVEFVFFCPFYSESQWELSPLNPANNVNKLGTRNRLDVYTVDRNGGLLNIQKDLVKKILTELNPFENIYFEVCNEPYFGGVTDEWHRFMAEYIAQVLEDLPKNHLISWNYANAGEEDLAKGLGPIDPPDPNISIYNFHYSNPPDVVSMNYHLEKVIGENETGFRGTADDYYRKEAWEFILAGGGLFNHLDYSFAVGFENGTFNFPDSQPGGGGPNLRRQLGILASFIARFNFVRMSPKNGIILSGLPDGARVHVLAETGQQYAIYIRDGEQAEPTIRIPDGTYTLDWIDPLTGNSLRELSVDVTGNELNIEPPEASSEIVLSIFRR